MIELAPQHKSGLPVPNPILLAGGTVGYGEARHSGLATERLGGLVVGPLLLNSRRGEEGPRLAELNGGFVLKTALQNRGLRAVLRQFANLWPRLGCPVIAQLADDQPDDLARVAGRLATVAGLSGLELLPPRSARPEQIRLLVRAAMRDNDLPVWVKLPLESAITLAPVAVEAGAAALVVGQPPIGSAVANRIKSGTAVLKVADRKEENPQSPLSDLATAGSLLSGRLISGPLFGPLLFAPLLTTLAIVSGLGLPSAIIACGGIYTASQVRQALGAGAAAVQIDAAVWVEPGLPARLVAALQ